MFVKVEAFNFTFLDLDTRKGAGGFHQIHEDHGGDKYSDANGCIADDLRFELIEAAAVRRGL